jgi:hypothetical protein
MLSLNSDFPWLIGIIGILLFSLSYYLAKKEVEKKKIEDLTDVSLIYFLKSVNLLWLDLLLLFFLLEINAESNFEMPLELSYLIFITVIIIQIVFHEASYRGRKRNAFTTMKSSHDIKNKMLDSAKEEFKSYVIDKNLHYLERFAEHYSIDGIRSVISEIEDYKEKPSREERIELRNKLIHAIIVLGRSKKHRHFNYAIHALKNILNYLEKS